MQVTVISKMQGPSEFSSEGVSLILSPSDIGLSDPTNAEEAKETFDTLCAYADFVIGGRMYRMGLMSKNLAQVRRKPYDILIQGKS